MLPSPREGVKPSVVKQCPHSTLPYVGIGGKDILRSEGSPVRDGLRTTKGKETGSKKDTRGTVWNREKGGEKEVKLKIIYFPLFILGVFLSGKP